MSHVLDPERSGSHGGSRTGSTAPMKRANRRFRIRLTASRHGLSPGHPSWVTAGGSRKFLEVRYGPVRGAAFLLVNDCFQGPQECYLSLNVE